MKARQHQIDLAKLAFAIIKKYGLVYLAMEERTGKSITAINVAELMDDVKKTLIVTKKKALEGWEQTLKEYEGVTKKYDLVNYHGVSKVKGKYDLIILDESHSYIAGYPKRSVMWKSLFTVCYGLPIIYSSATPHAQGLQMLFNQFALCIRSPWARFKNYYEWFKEYAKKDKEGNFKMVRINAHTSVVDFKAVDNDKILKETNHLFITKTRKELGFEQEPEDDLHYIELSEKTKAIYNIIVKDKVLEFTHRDTGKDYLLVCDTSMKHRCSLHMLEGGTLKINNDYIQLCNTEKLDYIRDTWGDSKDVVIMYQYIAEKAKLEKAFTNVRILQGTSFAEGTDLSMYKHLIIYSQDFSTSKHTQRRARQANMERKDEIKVHFLLVKKAVSEQVYKTCSINKENFVDSRFSNETL